MATNTHTVEDPILGEKMVFHAIDRDAEGEFQVVDLFVKPHGQGPPEHIHPIIEERGIVVTGTLHYQVNGKTHTAHAGEKFIFPRGARHTFWNESDEEAHVRAEIRPPMQFQAFIETMFGLSRTGKSNKQGLPSPLQAAVIFDEFKDEVQVAAPPIRLLLRVLAPLGRLMGYKATYPEFTHNPAAALPSMENRSQAR